MNTRFIVACLVLVLMAFVSFLFVSNLTPGMIAEGTDWAMYVMHARNIVTHHPYAETGYIFQPESTTEVGAMAYPSGLPLITAPLYAMEGFNLRYIKLLNSFFLVAALWPAFLLARRTLSPVSSLVLLITLGLSWSFFNNFDSFGSDSLYLFVSLWVLLFLLHIYDRQFDISNPWLWGLCAGMAMAGAYLVRPVGLAFLLAVGGTDLLRKRKISTFVIAIAITFVPIVFLNNIFTHADGGYTHQISSSVSQVIFHVREYLSYSSYLFMNPVSTLYRYFMWATTFAAAGFGAFQRVRKGKWGVTELYLLILLMVICVYWSTTVRYLLPIFPIYLVYAFEGFQALVKRFPRSFATALTSAGAACILLAPAINTVHLRPSTAEILVGSPTFQQMCSVVRSQTDKNAFFLFWNPRVLVFSTDRKASGWPAVPEQAEITRYFDHLHPDYIIVDKTHAEDRQFLIPVLDASGARLTTIYQNDRFRLLRLLPDAK